MGLTFDGVNGISATGNIISSQGFISATGNIYAGNLITALSTAGNVSGVNILASGSMLANGQISATGALTGASLILDTPLPVASGGTGLATLTDNSILVGNSTGTVKSVAPGTNANVLTVAGGAWTSQAPRQFSIVFQGEITVNAINTFTVDNTRSVMFFVYFGNGAGGNQFLFSNVEWGMPSLNQSRGWYASGVDFQVAQSGSLMAAFNSGNGTSLQIRVNANNLGAYGAPGSARCMVLQF